MADFGLEWHQLGQMNFKDQFGEIKCTEKYKIPRFVLYFEAKPDLPGVSWGLFVSAALTTPHFMHSLHLSSCLDL